MSELTENLINLSNHFSSDGEHDVDARPATGMLTHHSSLRRMLCRQTRHSCDDLTLKPTSEQIVKIVHMEKEIYVTLNTHELAMRNTCTHREQQSLHVTPTSRCHKHTGGRRMWGNPQVSKAVLQNVKALKCHCWARHETGSDQVQRQRKEGLSTLQSKQQEHS